MIIEGDATMLRVYVGQDDHWHGRSLHQAIIERARQEGLAGATVLIGIAGFGANSRIHTASILRLSEDLPVVIEMVDSDEKINAFVPILDEMVTEGLIIRQPCAVVKYVHN